MTAACVSSCFLFNKFDNIRGDGLVIKYIGCGGDSHLGVVNMEFIAHIGSGVVGCINSGDDNTLLNRSMVKYSR